MTTECRLKRSGGLMKHGEFMIISSEQTHLNVGPVGADAAATPTKQLKYARTLLSTPVNVIMANSEDGITSSETFNVLLIDTKQKSS